MRIFAISTVCAIFLFGAPACEAQNPDAALREAQEATAQTFRKQWCELAVSAGMPMRLSPGIRAELEKAGTDPNRLNEFLLPVARVNNAFGCFCAEGERRKAYKCP